MLPFMTIGHIVKRGKMKFDHEGFIQHIKDNHDKAHADYLIAKCNFGGGGTISEPKFTYNWAEHRDSISRGDTITDYIQKHYNGDEAIKLLDEYSDYRRYNRDGYEPAGCHKIKKVIEDIKQGEIIAAMERFAEL